MNKQNPEQTYQISNNCQTLVTVGGKSLMNKYKPYAGPLEATYFLNLSYILSE